MSTTKRTRSTRPRLPRKGSKMRQAFEVAWARQYGTGHPSGSTDGGGRWYPADDEECACCWSVRLPSRAWPWPMYKHCHSVAHVAWLYGVDEHDLRRLVRSRAPQKGGDRS